MIRICYVLATEVRAGVEEHVLSLVKCLDRGKFQVFVVAPPGLVDAFGKDLTDLDVTVLPLAIRGLTDMANRLRFWRFLQKARIDIVNTHMFQASLKFMPLAALARVPIRIETAHGIEQWRLDKGWIKRHSFIVDKWFSKLLTQVLAVSHGCKRDLVRIKGIPAERISVVHNGRDVTAFDPLCGREARQRVRQRYGIAGDELVFGVMARLEPQKGHAFLLEAVARIAARRQDFRVLLVGDGAKRTELQSLAARLGIGPRVIFAGFQSDVVGHYAAMDVKVLPSLWEGLPLCLIEAMAMEKPVIATEIEGTTEVVQHKRNGLLVPPRNAQALSEALVYALDHQAELQAIGRAGCEWARERFSLARQVRETEELYERLSVKTGTKSVADAR
jgi:glycosyltransferase involved in cell wall biosynthesis